MDLQVLRQLDLFRNLNPIQLVHFASIGEEIRLKKGATLFQEGDKAEHFYVITKGKIRISKMVPGIGEEALAILPAGSYFGEMELIDPSVPRAAYAFAHEDCILQVFPYKELQDLLNADSELALSLLWNMIRTLAQRMRATNDKVAAMFAMAKFGET